MNAEQIEKLIEVLEVGRDAAHEVAQRFHDEMKGYREAEHKQVDKNVAYLNEAIAMLEAERATQPVAKEMNDSEIQVLAELNFYSPDDPMMDGRLRRFARAILAATQADDAKDAASRSPTKTKNST